MAFRNSSRLFQAYLPMSAKTIDVIKATAPAVAPLAKKITQHFYPRMFNQNPAALAFFNQTNQKKGMQQEALADAVIAYASNIDNLAVLLPAVDKIAHRHVALGVTPELYQIVHDNLMASIGHVLTAEGIDVTPEIATGWSNAVMALAEICIGEEEKLYTMAEARSGGWRGYKEFELVKKETVAADTVAFDFKACDAPDTPIDFQPGQYLSIRVNEEASGVTSPRHYTVTSAPGDAFLQCTTRHVKGADGEPDGQVTSYMHTDIKVGDKVKLAPPCGVFTADKVFKSDKADVAFCTAGIGATLAQALSNDCRVNTVAVMHVDRCADYAGSLTDKMQKGPDVITQKVLGQSFDAVEECVRQFGVKNKQADIVLCGPMGFMKGAKATLEAEGCSKVHFELFGTGNMK